MSLTLSTAMASALAVNYPRPGAFVQLDFATPMYLHDRQGTKSWNSLSWTAADITCSGITASFDVIQRCTLQFVDSDNAIAQALRDTTNPAVGRSVKVWLYDATALATADPVLVFDGVMGAPSGGDNRRVSLQCTTDDVWLPRGFLADVIPAYMQVPEGYRIQFGNGTLIANRRAEYT